MTRITSQTPAAVTGRSPAMTVTAELRIPMQERGARRVETILDAAAALVVEVGVEGMTVQALAERAETSKGSLYHFFPDVPAVLRALADRHLQEIGALVSGIMTDSSIAWHELRSPEIVRRLLEPLDYLERNSDLLALIRAPHVLAKSARSMEPMREFVDFVFAARFPGMPQERRVARAATICAVIDGVVGTSVRGCMRGSAGMRAELEEMLSIYLDGVH